MTQRQFFATVIAVSAGVTAACSRPAPPATPSTLPSFLIGEWVSDSTTFNRRGGIESGFVLYLYADGLGAAIGAPPPIGSELTATFDPTRGVLRITIPADSGAGAPGEHRDSLLYDARKNQLRPLSTEFFDAPLTRRQATVPSFVWAMICDGRPATGVCAKDAQK